MIVEKHVRPGGEQDKVGPQRIIHWCTTISPFIAFVSFIPFTTPFVHVHASAFIHSSPPLFILLFILFVVINGPWAVEVKNKHAGEYDATESLELSKSFAPGALNEEELNWRGSNGRYTVEN
jgi:uncharacterized membrane protein